MSIFSNFFTSTNLEFISPPRHHPSQLTSLLTFLLTYPFLLQSFSLSTSPTPNLIFLLFMLYPTLSHLILLCPHILQNYAISPFSPQPFYTITMICSFLSHPSPPNFAHYPTPKHTKTRKSSTFFLEFPQPNSWNFLNFFSGMNIQIENLKENKWKKGIPAFKAKAYEINQIFNLKFYYEKETQNY